MRIATWVATKEVLSMNQHARTMLVDQIEAELALPPTASFRDACRRVCEVIGQRMQAPVQLRFVSLSNPSVSGATALHADGSCTILIAASPFWYHRLQILLHELAHHLLGHQPVPMTAQEGLRRLLPLLPEQMADILATRTNLCQDEEQEAEELADELLERLTTKAGGLDAAPDLPDHVRRVADALGHNADWRER